MLVKTSGIVIPKTHSQYEMIRSELDRWMETWDGNSVNIKFYEENSNSILIPRYYPVRDKINDNSEEGVDIEISTNIIPRNERQVTAIDLFLNDDKGILQLEPGSGKTVVAIAAISKIKKRTIIIAHKDKLLEQWKDAFIGNKEKGVDAFTDLTDDDVGRLSTQNFEECFQKKIILTTPHVIAYAVKRKNNLFIQALKNAGIGMLIVDECHANIGPEQFSKCSLFLNCKRTYGLSATPSRGDGTDDIMTYHLGDVNYIPPEEGELLKPIVHMVYFPYNTFSREKKYLMWGGQFQLSRYYNQIYKSNEYNNTLAKWIVKAYKGGRVILVLGKNIKPLLKLAEVCELPRHDVGVFTPGALAKKYTKQMEEITDTRDLDQAFLRQVVFSNAQTCRDGNNRKEFDVLVMAVPTQNVEQAVGRILRVLDGKKQPIVIDPVDVDGPKVIARREKEVDGEILVERINTTWFVRSALKRLDQYKKQGWEVKTHKVDPNKE